MKAQLIQDIQKKIRENWEENTFVILMKVQDSIDMEDVKLEDISFGMKRGSDYVKECLQYVLHFKVKEMEIKIDYLEDEEADEDNENDALTRFFPHQLYSIFEDATNSVDFQLYEKHNVKYKLNYAMVDTLNSLEIFEVLKEFKNEIKSVRAEYVKMKDQEFFQQYKEYLSGVVRVEASLGSKVTLILESGLPLKVDKYGIEYWAKNYNK